MFQFSFNHIALSIKNVDKSVAFYQEVFQFKEIENTASSSKTRWLSIGGGKELHLIPYFNSDEVKVNKGVHFALAMQDVKSFVYHLEDLKINWSDWKDTPSKGYVRKDGVHQVYFQDPDGYWIEVNNAI